MSSTVSVRKCGYIVRSEGSRAVAILQAEVASRVVGGRRKDGLSCLGRKISCFAGSIGRVETGCLYPEAEVYYCCEPEMISDFLDCSNQCVQMRKRVLGKLIRGAVNACLYWKRGKATRTWEYLDRLRQQQKQLMNSAGA